jgi:hypothetical protein
MTGSFLVSMDFLNPTGFALSGYHPSPSLYLSSSSSFSNNNASTISDPRMLPERGFLPDRPMFPKKSNESSQIIFIFLGDVHS